MGFRVLGFRVLGFGVSQVRDESKAKVLELIKQLAVE